MASDADKYEIKELVAYSPEQLLRRMDVFLKQGWRAYGYIKFWEGDWRDRTYRAWVFRDKPQPRLELTLGPVRLRRKGKKNARV